MIEMIRCVKRICGKEIRLLRSPILLTILDTVLSMSMAGMLAAALLSLAIGQFNKQVLIIYTSILLITFVIRCFVYSIAYVKSQVNGSEIVTNLRITLGDHIRSLSLGYINTHSVGTLNNALTTDISDFESVLTHSLSDFIKVITYTILAIGFAMFMNIQYAFVLLILITAAMPLLNLGGKAAEKSSGRVRAATSKVISRVIEYINGIKTFRLYNLTGKKFKNLDQSLDDLKNESIRLELSLMPYTISFSVVVSFIIPLGLVLGGLFLKNNVLSSNAYIIQIMLSISISGVMSLFASLYAGMKFLNKASANIVDILNQQPLPYKLKKAEFKHYDICFEHVGFRYKEGVEVLKNVSFTADNKQVTALIGPSGSGKSTIINLVLRFWDRTSGSITVGGIDIKDIDPDTLTENIAAVFQDVYLMKDTIINNIKLAKPKATFEEIKKCAEIAHCHDFISKMELGYETVIGEGGATLSGERSKGYQLREPC